MSKTLPRNRRSRIPKSEIRPAPPSGNSQSFLFLGIDGCPAGWVGVIADSQCRFVDFPLLWHSTQQMTAALDSFKLALIDIPIGLPSDSSGRRTCDIVARQFLRAKRSSVFLPPVRQTLHAKNYQQANEINYEICGKKISKQMWNILPKIRSVDQGISGNPSLQSKLRESHPEVCFYALNNQQPLLSKKRTDAGMNDRLELLSKFSKNTHAYFDRARTRYPRRMLALDDIIDAMALALNAALGSCNGLVSIPTKAEYDATGLHMEMVFGQIANGQIASGK